MGSTSEREYENANLTDEHLDSVIERAFDILPDLQNAKVLARWAGVRPRSKSRAPVLVTPDQRIGIHSEWWL